MPDDPLRKALSTKLQRTLKSNPALKLEFHATMSRLFREHKVKVEPEILRHLTLSLEKHPEDDEPPPGT